MARAIAKTWLTILVLPTPRNLDIVNLKVRNIASWLRSYGVAASVEMTSIVTKYFTLIVIVIRRPFPTREI